MKQGHVYQRGDTWTYVIDLPSDPLTGRRQKSKGGFPSEREAEIAKTEALLEIEKGHYKVSTKMTVAEYLNYWLEVYSLQQHRLTTYTTNRDILLKRVVPVLGKIKLANLTAELIEQFLKAEKKNNGFSDAYIHGIFRVLRVALRMAHYKWDLIPVDIMRKVTAPSVEKREYETWTLEQCGLFLEHAEKSRFFEAYLVAINSGLRRGEVLGMPETDVNLARKYFEVNQALNYISDRESLRKFIELNSSLNYSSEHEGFFLQDPKTPKSKRRMPIMDQYILEKLEAKLELNRINRGNRNIKDKSWVLLHCHPDGSPISPGALRYDYENIIKVSGLPPIRFHDLRHSFATNLWELGYDLKDIGELLGHSSIIVTGDVYTHMRDDKKKDVLAGFSKAINRARK